MVFDASAIQAVSAWVFETGMFQWNNAEVVPTAPIEELMPTILGTPTVFE